jgi:acetyl-CoA synthetase
MSESKLYDVPANVAASAYINNDKYNEMYQRSISDPEGFWAEQAEEFVDWMKPWSKVWDWDFDEARIAWFEGAKLNVAYNCLDRHLATRGDQVAVIKKITYRELHEDVCKFANALKSRGVKKGDRVSIYMPMVPEVVVAMLACARIGAVHSIVFGGFSPESLKDRILDSDCRVVITADEGLRGARPVPLKANTDKALEACPNVHTVVVVKGTGGDIAWHGHSTGGYLLFVAMTHKYIFDYHDGDIYWCTADVGWVTGHSYIVYGPLANGATTLVFEGLPTYPDASRFWQVVDKHQVNIFYTAPTALRALMGQGNELVEKTSRKSLKLLGTVGEPINPEAWEWYYHVVGEERCPIVDTWWQTETGGILITPLPGATKLKPGSATRPFFGVVPEIVDAEGNVLDGACEGNLCIRQPWPGQMRTVYGDHQRFKETYFSTYKGKYFTGDGARRDADGYYWITGRVDDVINISGHRMGTAEVESALVLHEQVAEAAVVGYPHDIKGQGIYAYVTLMAGTEGSEDLRKDLVGLVRKEIGPIASPDVIQWAPGLPKTRSGKIMRRILRKVAANEVDALGDTTTLADPSVVDDLIANRANK